MRSCWIAPSMMCADIGRLTETLEIFRETGVEYLHIDVMDGVFVPNYALGVDYVRRLRRLSPIPLDIHLMVDRPEDKIGWFDVRPGDFVSVHCESTPHLHRAVSKIREAGARPAAALNPATPYRAVEHILDDLDAVLVMTVNPGYAGQKLIEASLLKIANLRRWLDESGYCRLAIEVDGNVSFDNARRMREAGADFFVAGSSSVFAAGSSLRDAVRRFRDAVTRGDSGLE